MANAIYPKWKEALITGAANAALNGSGGSGTPSLSGIVGTDQEIGATKTYTNGVFDGADLTHPSVTGSSAEALVLYVKNAGSNTTWRLVAYIDTGVTGLPVTPNGGNIGTTWNASGILAL